MTQQWGSPIIISGSKNKLSDVHNLIDALEKSGVDLIVIEEERGDLEVYVPPAIYVGDYAKILLTNLWRKLEGNNHKRE